MKVLLLEDDNLLSDLLNDHLLDKGYNVTLCLKWTRSIRIFNR